MRAVVLAFACLACAGHGRRVQSPRKSYQVEPDAMRAFASLLQASKPAAGFQASAMQRPNGIKSPLGLRTDVIMQEEASAPAPAPKMSQALPFVECPAHLDGTYAGDVGFDPLNFGAMGNLKWMREAELKHGRICMLATFGIIFQEFFSIPKYPGYSPNPVEAAGTVPMEGLLQILAFAAYVEITSNKGKIDQFTMFEDPNRKPGDVGFDPLKFGENPETRARLELAELKNGRLAMLAFFGMIVQVQVTGKPVIASLGDIFANPN
mmetsp:Transcript_113790/g.201656  ORF Transcript_113790/g.201656 Transcript_113790/m.201656 type:complete len:265 (-) Transcript_113790:77-871(-)